MGAGERLREALEVKAPEAIAVVGLVVLLIGFAAVADDRQGGEQLDVAPVVPTSAAPEPTPHFAPLPVPTPVEPRPPAPVTTTTTQIPTPVPTAVPAAVATADVQGDERIVVLSVDAPTTVSAGQTVTFTVSVRASGGTPVLSGARFGDGVEGGAPAPCAGEAGPSFTGSLRVSHTYAAAGTYRPYFVATIPCGPSAGAGTSLTVTGGGPTATAVPSTATPSATDGPTPGGTPTAPLTTVPTAPEMPGTTPLRRSTP